MARTTSVAAVCLFLLAAVPGSLGTPIENSEMDSATLFPRYIPSIAWREGDLNSSMTSSMEVTGEQTADIGVQLINPQGATAATWNYLMTWGDGNSTGCLGPDVRWMFQEAVAPAAESGTRDIYFYYAELSWSHLTTPVTVFIEGNNHMETRQIFFPCRG